MPNQILNHAWSHLVENLHTLYGNYWLVAILMLYLGIATYTDVRSLKIHDKLNIGFFLLRLLLIPILGFSWSNVEGGLFAFVLFFGVAMVLNHACGGDIKAVTVMGFYLGMYLTIPFIALVCAYYMAFIMYQLKYGKGKKFTILPLAPFFLTANISLFVISLFL